MYPDEGCDAILHRREDFIIGFTIGWGGATRGEGWRRRGVSGDKHREFGWFDLLRRWACEYDRQGSERLRIWSRSRFRLMSARDLVSLLICSYSAKNDTPSLLWVNLVLQGNLRSEALAPHYLEEI